MILNFLLEVEGLVNCYIELVVHLVGDWTVGSLADVYKELMDGPICVGGSVSGCLFDPHDGLIADVEALRFFVFSGARSDFRLDGWAFRCQRCIGVDPHHCLGYHRGFDYLFDVALCEHMKWVSCHLHL